MHRRAALTVFSVLAVALIVTLSFSALLIDQQSPGEDAVRVRAQIAPVLPEPRLRQLTRHQAEEINSRAGLSGMLGPPAQPFFIVGTSESRAIALRCLTEAVYYEAANEPRPGQEAVAQVVLNRIRHPSFPGSLCAVVYQGADRVTGCQFSFTCDGSLGRQPTRQAWLRATSVASAALAGHVTNTVGLATHYHADYVVPYWAADLDRIAKVGHHLFYRWRGFWGTKTAFRQRYLGAEKLRVTEIPLLDPQPLTRMQNDATNQQSSQLAEFSGLKADQVQVLGQMGKVKLMADDGAGQLDMDKVLGRATQGELTTTPGFGGAKARDNRSDYANRSSILADQ